MRDYSEKIVSQRIATMTSFVFSAMLVTSFPLVAAAFHAPSPSLIPPLRKVHPIKCNLYFHLPQDSSLRRRVTSTLNSQATEFSTLFDNSENVTAIKAELSSLNNCRNATTEQIQYSNGTNSPLATTPSYVAEDFPSSQTSSSLNTLLESQFHNHLQSIINSQSARTSQHLYQAHTSYDKSNDYNAGLAAYAELMGMHHSSGNQEEKKLIENVQHVFIRHKGNGKYIDKNRKQDIVPSSKGQAKFAKHEQPFKNERRRTQFINLRDEPGHTTKRGQRSTNKGMKGRIETMRHNDSLMRRNEIPSIQLLWEGPLLQPSISSYTLVAQALVSPSNFHKIGGYRVCRLLDQLLARVDALWNSGVSSDDLLDRVNNRLTYLPSKGFASHEMASLALRPTADLIMTIMEALARIGEGTRAQDLLTRMEKDWEELRQGYELELVEKFRPTRESYEIVIRAQSHYTNWREQEKSQLQQENPADRVDAILRHMELISSSGKNSAARPIASTYTEAIKAYSRGFVSEFSSSRSADENATTKFNPATRALSTFNHLKYLFDCSGDASLRPTMDTYTALITAYGKSHGGLNAAHAAHALMEEAHGLWKESAEKRSAPVVDRKSARWDVDDRPSTALYTSVMDAYAKSNGGKEAVMIVENLLEKMEKGVDDAPKPNEWTYTAVINTLVHNGRENRVQKAEQILRRMILPDKLAYSCVIHAWSQSREKGAALQADRLLMELYDVAHSLVVNEERDEDDNHHNLDWIDTGSNKDDRCHSKGRTPLQPPDATTIAAVIHSYAKGTSQEEREAAPERSLDLLRRMITSLEQYPTQRHTPDMWIFNTVLQIWSISGRKDAGEQAEKILAMINRFGQQSFDSFAYYFPFPNVQSYTFVIDAWANSNDPRAGKKALDMIRQPGFKPNARFISSTIEAIHKSRGDDMVPLELIKQMVVLNKSGDDSSLANSKTFTKAISKGDAQNALDVLKYLDELGDQSLGPNSVHINAVIASLSKSDLPDRIETAEALFQRLKKDQTADIITYTAMISALANCDEINKCDRAEKLLHDMEEYGIAPSTRVYNAVIKACGNGNKKGAGDRALSLVKRMEKEYTEGNLRVKPDVITYTNACSALRNDSQIYNKAKYLLRHVTKPDIIFYTNILDLLCRNSRETSLLLSENILDRMDARYKSGELQMQPNSYIINMLIHGWAVSTSRQKAVKAKRMLDRIKKMDGVDASEYSYNWVIYAAATSSTNPKESFTIANNAYQELINNEDSHPDSYTFSFYIKACGKDEVLSPNAKITDAFHLCCTLGQLSNEVLLQIKKSAPSLIISLGCESMDVKDLPLKWSRHVG